VDISSVKSETSRGTRLLLAVEPNLQANTKSGNLDCWRHQKP